MARGRCRARTSWSSWSPIGSVAGGASGVRARRPHAARMAGIARTAGLATVLTNAVRYADRLDAPTIDVLDAARRLVPLGSTHLRDVGPTGSRGNAEGFLKSGKQMHEVAEEVCRLSGLGDSSVGGPAAARAHARRRGPVRPRPRADLGIGEVHFPELEPLGRASTVRRPRAPPALRGRDRPALRQRTEGGGLEAPRRRARDDPRARLRVVLPHGRRRHRHGRGAGHPPGRPRVRGRQPRQLPARDLRGRPDPPRPADGAVPLARGARRCPTSTSTSSPRGARRSTARSSTATAASAARPSR